jgi:hypothetical protein
LHCRRSRTQFPIKIQFTTHQSYRPYHTRKVVTEATSCSSRRRRNSSSSIFAMFAKLLQKITAQQESSQVLSPNLISLNYCIANLIFILFVNVVNCMNLGNTCFDDDFFCFRFSPCSPNCFKRPPLSNSLLRFSRPI